ncbi:MAG: amidase family protein [Aeromicrobium sp.]
MNISDMVSAGPWAQRELLERGDITSRQLVEATLEALTRTQQRLNSCVALYDTSALDAADEADRRRAAGETAPLLGIPIAIKDDTDIAGVVTSWGSRAMTRPAAADADLITRIREAGMILVAKTTLPELAICGFTETRAFGVTRNPHNRAFTPGGSSGGSAASVADGAVGIATGTDGAGSIRIPAACCGLVGFKPTHGTMPSSGGWHGLSTQGCLTRKVIDSALYLDTFGSFGGSLVEASQTEPAALRIGIDLHPFPASVPLEVDPRVVGAVAGVGDILTGLGHDVRTVRVRYGTAAQAMTARYLAGIRDVAAGTDDPKMLEKRTRQIARLGKPFGARAIARAREAGRKFGETLLEDLGIDVLLTPTMSGPAVRVGFWEGKGGLRTVLGMGRFYAFTPAWNHTGQPAVSLPAGITEEEGLPLAIQLIAARGDDARLMGLAGQYERALGARTKV